MSDPQDPHADEAAPSPSGAPPPRAIAVPRRRRHLYAVWLIPLIAALIGLTLALRSFLDSGPTITIVFKTAEGLEAGKTKIKYKNVDIGDVRSVTLSREGDGVVVTAEMAKAAQKLLADDTRFWVERARLAGTGVTGISTLLSGAYIGIDAGKSDEARRDFVGLDTPPPFTTDEPGREFTLHAGDVGSVDIGSPVYLRRVVVGKVTAAQLDPDGRGVTLRVFIAAPHEKLVTENSRFWHASGLDVSLDAGGIKLQTQSILSVLLGGIAFATPESEQPVPQAGAGHSFRLFDNQATAMKRGDAEITPLVAYFSESLRGLEPGAQIDFRGVVVGEVTSIDIEYDRDRHAFRFPVGLALYRDRVRSKVTAALERAHVDPGPLLQDSIARGLRAQLRTANLLSGQRYVALDFFKNAPPVRFEAKASPMPGPLELPTMPGSLEDLQTSITNIAKRIESLPLPELVSEVRGTMKSLDATLVSTDRLMRRLDTQIGELAPELRATLGEARQTLRNAGQLLSDDAPTPQALRESLRELSRAAQSLRELGDYLQRRPESLLRGKPAEAAPTAGESR